MRFYTHFVFGMLCTLIIFKFFTPNSYSLFAVSVFLGLLFPDIDNASSKLGKKVKPVSWILQHTVGHRGIFHSLLLGLTLSYFLLQFSTDASIGFIIGYLSHMLLDSLTPAGIMWFFPFSVIKARGKIKTGSITEYIMLVLLIGLILLLFLH